MFYTTLPDAQAETLAGRPIVSTAQNGKIVLDKVLFSLLQLANGKTQAEITADFQAKNASPLNVAAGLACLAEAGLLVRNYEKGEEAMEPVKTAGPSIPFPAAQVSAVIVAYNGMKWLPVCLDSLKAQSLGCAEIIVVDNGSSDGTVGWVNEHHPDVHLIEPSVPLPFAAALNKGIETAKGDFFLALNQDVELERDAVAHLVNQAGAAGCAAVAACLRLAWAPAFLNGLGNQVRAVGWGTDNFIGALDLGQFENQNQVPSVCLAAALIRQEAWQQVGPLDEGFPMYYEDTEWSYRARLMGWEMRAAPQALVYHAFGGGTAGLAGIGTAKLENVVYGRLRFHSKLFYGWRRVWKLLICLAQDGAGLLGAALRLRPDWMRAYWRGWMKWLRQPPATVRLGKVYPAAVFATWPDIPAPRTWRGLPELTWEAVCCDYLPLMIAGRTRPLPEMSGLNEFDPKSRETNFGLRLALLWEGEGLRAILRRCWRNIRWKLG